MEMSVVICDFYGEDGTLKESDTDWTTQKEFCWKRCFKNTVYMVHLSTNQVTNVLDGIERDLNLRVVGVGQVSGVFRKHLKYLFKILQFD